MASDTWYELINPSDPIEFSAESDEVAALAALVLGVGSYSARRLINGQAVGPQVIGFAFFGGDGGYQTIYGRSLNEGMSALRAELTSAFASFRIKGGGERSSLSDICAVAHRNAKVIARGGVAP